MKRGEGDLNITKANIVIRYNAKASERAMLHGSVTKSGNLKVTFVNFLLTINPQSYLMYKV